jgi:hypothetical protein
MALTRYGKLRNELLRQAFPTVFAPAVLRDADSGYVPLPISERLAQCIWYDQRLAPGPLRTVDGQPVTVVFPGWWNLEAGPDFRHATVRLGDEEVTGDIEIHLRAEDWAHHRHDRDPLYNDVILHVVLWEAGSETRVRTRTGTVLPQLVLQPQLAAPLEQLHDEIDLDAYPHNVGNHAGRCAAQLQALDPAAIGALFESAGDERFASKTRRFVRWIHHHGAEQAFYEGWMEALGYKANKVAFRALAQRAPLRVLREHTRHLAPVLFGLANFLPTGTAPTRDPYRRRLWNAWWKLRPDFADQILAADRWRLAGVRPANHPHRRLGAAVALLKRHPNFAEKVIAVIESNGDPARLFLEVRDEYWSRHFTLGGKTQTRESELIGAARAGEIVANIVLPFVAACGETRGDVKLRQLAATRFAALRPSADHALIRLAGQQLFGHATATRRYLRTARQQQGLLQVFQDFCLNDKSGCRQCQFPELARRWKISGAYAVVP